MDWPVPNDLADLFRVPEGEERGFHTGKAFPRTTLLAVCKMWVEDHVQYTVHDVEPTRNDMNTLVIEGMVTAVLGSGFITYKPTAKGLAAVAAVASKEVQIACTEDIWMGD